MAVSERNLRRASRITGVPLWILQRVDRQEGSGTSPKGARGEFQLMPGTARNLERKYGINTSTVWGNTLGGAYYLAEQYHTFKRWDYALAAYNAGPNAVRQYHGIPPYKETQNYVRSIMSGKPAGVKGRVPGAPGGDVSFQLPGAPAAAPYQGLTPEAVAGEGLSALASGSYDPSAGLQRLLAASRQMEKWAESQSGVKAPMTTNSLPNTPNVRFVGGGSAKDKRAFAFVRRAMGTPYVWGGSTPGGFDCSGLLYWAWAQVGIKIPRTSQAQWASGTPVKGGLRLGDAVFFRGYTGGKGGPGHVGFYIGGGKFIEAQKSGTRVHIRRLSQAKGYMGARRFA